MVTFMYSMIDKEDIMQKARAEYHFDSGKESGNIYHILGAVSNFMRKQRRINEWNDLSQRVLNSHSYEEALKIIREYVDLVDDANKF